MNTSLKEINLSHSIGAEAKAIAEGLKVNASLTGIYLTGNNIGDEGVKELAYSKSFQKVFKILISPYYITTKQGFHLSH